MSLLSLPDFPPHPVNSIDMASTPASPFAIIPFLFILRLSFPSFLSLIICYNSPSFHKSILKICEIFGAMRSHNIQTAEARFPKSVFVTVYGD